MSNVIDQKVVQMQFDNSQFEKNVKTSMSTIEKLKQSLNFTGAAKGLENVNAAAGKCTLSPLSNAAETVKLKFSAMEVMAVTALANITNSAVNAGKRIVSALTIDPIKTGFQEYETQINSVQTILANTQSKGTTLDNVNAALDELNAYADKTIYNFTEMTRNIGTFTAAGVDLETSVSAIQGIANLAAVSGSTSQQASTAMYQLSQALASGTVKLMDWNSVVNAGMGGEVFQNALKETARLHGVAIDKMIEDQGSFRETLSEGWLTSEILTETLSKFTTSGVNEYLAENCNVTLEAVNAMREEALATGDTTKAYKEMAKTLAESSELSEDQIYELLNMSTTAEDAATKVKTFTQLWDTMKEAAQSGWTQTWEIIVGDFEEAKEFLSELSDKFGAVIGGISEARNNLLEGALGSKWDSFTKQINEAGVSTDEFKDKLAETAKEVDGIDLDKLIKEHGSLSKVINKGLIPAKTIIETLKSFGGTAKDVSEATEDVNAKLEKFQQIVDKVWNGDFGNGAERMQKLAEAGWDYATVQELVNKTVDGHRLTLEDLSDAQLENLGFTQEQIASLRELAEQAEKTGTPLNELINSLEKPSGRELLLDTLKNGLETIETIIKAIKDAWKNIFGEGLTSDDLYGVIEKVHTLSEEVKEFVSEEENIKKITSAFQGLFAALDLSKTFIGGVFGIAYTTLKKVLGMQDADILTMVANVGDAIVAFRNWILTHDALVKACNAVFNVIDAGIDVLNEFVKGIMDSESVQTILESLSVRLVYAAGKIIRFFRDAQEVVSDFFKVLDKEGAKGVLEHFLGAVFDFFANLPTMTLEGAIAAFTNLKTKISESLSGLGEKFSWLTDLIGKFVDFVKAVLPSAISILMGVGLIKGVQKIGSALELLASPLKLMGNIGKMFDSLGDAFKRISKAISFNVVAGGIQKLAIALAILVASLAVLAFIPTEKLDGAVKAMWNITGMLALLTGAIALLCLAVSKIGSINMTSVAISMTAIAASLLLLVGALRMMQDLDADTAAKNAVNLVGMAVGLALAVKLLTGKDKQFTSGALTILALALALKVMVSALKDISNAGITDIGKSMLVITALTLLMSVLLKSCSAIKGSSMLGILAMVASLKLIVMVMEDISELDHEKIMNSLSSIIIIIGSISTLMIASRFAGEHAAKGGIGILAVSVALMVIIQCIKQLDGIDGSTLLKATATIGAILVLFAGIVAVSYFAGEHAVKAGMMLLLMSGAIMVLTGVIALLKYIVGTNPGDVWQAVGIIAALSAIFAGLIFMSKYASSGKAKGIIIALTTMVVAMAALVAVLAIIPKDKLITASACLVGIVGVFALLVAATKFLNHRSMAVAVKKIATLAGLVVIVTMLALVVKALSECDPKSALASTAALSVLLIALSGACVILSKSGRVLKSALNAAYQMLPIIGMLTLLIAMLAQCNPVGVLASAGALSAMVLALSAACVVLSKSGSVAKSATKAAASLAILVGLLAIPIGILSHYDPVGVLASATALSGMVSALAAACVILGTIKSVSKSALKAAVELGLITVALGIVIGVLSTCDPTGVLASAGAMSGMVIALSAACVVLGLAAPVAGMALATAGVMTLVVGALAVIIGLLSNNCDPKSALPVAAALSVLILSLSAACVVLAGVGALGPAAFIGIGALAALVVAIGALMVAIGALADHYPGMEEFLDKGFGLLEKIGYGLGSFIGSFVGGLGAGITSGLPDMADDLAAFMENLQPFIKGAKNIDEEAIKGVKNLAGMVLLITGADILSSATAWLTGGSSLSDFATELVPFGEAIAAFSKEVSGIDESAVTSAASAGKMLAEMANAIPNSGGVAGFFSGENDIDTFGTQLVVFGKAIANFSKTVSGNVDEGAVTAAANAGNIMVALANEIPNSGGVLGWIMGNNDLSTFGGQLVIFGRAMVNFSNIVKDGGISVGAVQNAANAANIMTALAKELPTNENSLWGWISGTTNIDTFGKQLVVFGKAMANFSKTVNGNIDAKAVEAAADAGNIMVALAQSLPEDDGWFGDVFGGTDELDSFGKKLVTFADHMVEFSKTLSGNFDISTVESTVESAKKVVNVISTIPDQVNMTQLSVALEEIGTAFIDFSEQVKGKVNIANISVVTDAAKKIAETATIMPAEVDLAKLTTGLNTFGTSILDLSTALESGNIDQEKISAAVSAGKMIADLISAFPVDMDWESTVNCIKELGGAIVNFSGAVEGEGAVNADKIISAVHAGESIASLMGELSYQVIDLTDFVANVTSLANGIKSFSLIMSEKDVLNSTAITNACTAGTKIAGLVESIGSKYYDITDFINNLVSLGNAIVGFSSVVSVKDAIALTSINNACAAGNSLVNLFNNIGNNTIDISSFIDNLPKLADSIVSFVNTVKGIDTTGISGIIDSVSEVATKAGEAMSNNLADGFESGKGKISSSINTITDAVRTQLMSKSEIMRNCGDAITNNFSLGISENDSPVIAFRKIVNDILTILNSPSLAGRFASAGAYVVAGFANGITAATFKAEAAAAAMAGAVLEAARATLDEHSPSKESYKIGNFFGVGFVNAIDDYGVKAYKAGSEMATYARNGLAKAIAKVNNLISDGIDEQPTIRPVLDLSDVTSKANRLNSMFGMNPSVGVLANVGAINHMMNRNQNGANDDVINAIKDLGRKIANSSGDSYNINGVTYDDGSNISDAVQSIVRAARIERRR